MASLIYNSFWNDLANNNINPTVDSFKCMLVTSAYTENKDTHTKRSDVTGEVAAAGGYSAGGVACTVSVAALDLVNDRQDITLGGISINSATITARKAVIYKARGGASSADELVAVIDFGSDIVSTAGTWALTASTIRIQN